MNREVVRTWGPVLLIVALLPIAFLALRAWLPAIGPRTLPPEAPAPEPEPIKTGAESCGSCHPAEQEKWARSTHSRAESPVPADLQWAVTLGDQVAPAPVRALGVDPLVQFLVPFDRGRLQVTQAA